MLPNLNSRSPFLWLAVGIVIAGVGLWVSQHFSESKLDRLHKDPMSQFSFAGLRQEQHAEEENSSAYQGNVAEISTAWGGSPDLLKQAAKQARRKALQSGWRARETNQKTGYYEFEKEEGMELLISLVSEDGKAPPNLLHVILTLWPKN